jgi:adenylate cyclase
VPGVRKSRVVNPTTLTVATIALVVSLFAIGPAILEAIELNWLDLRFRVRGPIKPAPTVVLAVIDEKSIAAEGRWPWPRSRIAELVEALSDDGAKAIGFDIAFAEAEENPRLALANQIAKTVEALDIRNPKLVEFIRDTQTSSDNDQALRAALERSAAPVVLGYFFHMNEASAGKWLDLGEVAQRNRRIEGSKYPLVRFRGGDAASVSFLKAYAPQANLDVFTAVAASSGYFSVVGDPDGSVRWMPMVIQSGDELYPPLSLLCAWHYLGKPPLSVRVGEHGVEGVQLGERFVPTDETGQLLLNYRGPPHTFPHYSVSDILAGRLPRGTFRDRIVLVGVTALGVYDIRSTPFHPVYPGLEIHATATDNVLTGDFLSRPRWSGIFDIGAIVALGALVGVVLPRMSAVGALGFSAALAFGYVLVALGLFVGARVWLNVVYPLLAVALAYTTLTVYRYLTEERERKRIKDTFRHYVAPDVIEQVLDHPEQLRLGGQDRELTVLFCDLAGFTTYSERYTPSEIIQILAEYYDRMTDAVFAQRGTVTDYIGDELMAIFGAPVAYADHARAACAAALAMRDARIALAAEWATIGRPALRARTGINTGRMLVGNVGSKQRFAYTVLGDQVNLASRLESLNKAYATEIMVGEQTAAVVAGDFALRELDRVKVKGRDQALSIHEVLARSLGELPQARQAMLRDYAAALAAYREGRWSDALGLFDSALVHWPEDGPSRVMGERVRAFVRVPPPGPWTGVFEHQEK